MFISSYVNVPAVPAAPASTSRSQDWRWAAVLEAEFEAFCRRVDDDEDTTLDPYGATGVDEFFAVAVEAFFVAPQAMRNEHPRLYALFDVLDIEHMRTSKGALREGVIYDLMGRLSHEDVRERTVHALMQRYAVDADTAATIEAIHAVAAGPPSKFAPLFQ